jgi:hypothetical protein
MAADEKLMTSLEGVSSMMAHKRKGEAFYAAVGALRKSGCQVRRRVMDDTKSPIELYIKGDYGDGLHRHQRGAFLGQCLVVGTTAYWRVSVLGTTLATGAARSGPAAWLEMLTALEMWMTGKIR